MKTQACEFADHAAIALSEEGRRGAHASCPGAYISPGGGVHACSCSCHPERDQAQLEAIAAETPLPVLEPPAAPAGPEVSPEKGTKEGSRGFL